MIEYRSEVRAIAPTLTVGTVHLWPLWLSTWAGVDWTPLLSSDELSKAGRFAFGRDAERFMASHGITRVILAGYLGRRPGEISFGHAAHGKPFLLGEPMLRFNLSHSDDAALIGITLGREIGVDVERTRDDFDLQQIARQFFSGAEQASLGSLPPDKRCEAFFACWTRKEAFVKARGDGLSLPLDQFDVSLIPGEPARLLATRPDRTEVEAWEAHSLNFGSGYAAAVMTERGALPANYTVIDSSAR